MPEHLYEHNAMYPTDQNHIPYSLKDYLKMAKLMILSRDEDKVAYNTLD